MADVFNISDASPYDRGRRQIGQWCIPNDGYFFSAAVATASQYRVARFVATRNMTVVKIGFVTSIAATNDDAVDVGLFTSAGVKLVSSGATSGKANATAGVQTITIAATSLIAGTVYYAGLAYGTVGGTAASIVQIAGGATFIPQMFGTAVGTKETTLNNGATLPDPIVVTGNSGNGFALAVLES